MIGNDTTTDKNHMRRTWKITVHFMALHSICEKNQYGIVHWHCKKHLKWQNGLPIKKENNYRIHAFVLLKKLVNCFRIMFFRFTSNLENLDFEQVAIYYSQLNIEYRITNFPLTSMLLYIHIHITYNNKSGERYQVRLKT